jgi:hypothetical protein
VGSTLQSYKFFGFLGLLENINGGEHVKTSVGQSNRLRRSPLMVTFDWRLLQWLPPLINLTRPINHVVVVDVVYHLKQFNMYSNLICIYKVFDMNIAFGCMLSIVIFRRSLW